MMGPTMWLLVPKFFFVIFLTFERDSTILRDTLVENVKKVKNQPNRSVPYVAHFIVINSAISQKKFHIKTMCRYVQGRVCWR
jgi:hypothetical protein